MIKIIIEILMGFFCAKTDTKSTCLENTAQNPPWLKIVHRSLVFSSIKSSQFA